MDFDRARNQEQRNMRVEQIKKAAVQLFDMEPFHEITLAKIANKTDFTRENLYRYISTKEEIYLLVTFDEIMDWIDDLEKTITGGLMQDMNSFSNKWANVMHRHQRFLKLISLLYTIIEKNVSLESLIDFKKKFAVVLVRLFTILKVVFPMWDDKTSQKFISMQMQYSIGLFSTTSMTSLQKEAIKQSGIPYEAGDFVDDFSEFIRYTVRNLTVD